MRHFFIPTLAAALVVSIFAFGSPRDDAPLLRLDFEQTFYVRSGWEVWDFCIVQDDGLFHLFFHSRPEGSGHSYPIRSIEHAVSEDLTNWTDLPPALEWEGLAHQSRGMWAPHVVRDNTADRWVMAYTGVTEGMVQRICIAYSQDLHTWVQESENPVFEPDSLTYAWAPSEPWSSCRDPFLSREGDTWVLLNTVRLRNTGSATGGVHRSTSSDLINWTDEGMVFLHDGENPWHDIESVQYAERNGLHHLFFTEYGVSGVSHVSSPTYGDWTMADRVVLGRANAPEIVPRNGFDILGRYATFQHPESGQFSFVLRFDTLAWDPPDVPRLHKPDPLDRDWALHTGTATLGNPVFGDNPGERGEPAPGHTGNFWFSSREYYRGPGSDVGAPGAMLGDFARGTLESRPFALQGDVIDLLVGGGDYPATCAVSLVDAEDGTVLATATGNGDALMTPRRWHISQHHGRNALIRIHDQEGGVNGFLAVDEIVEKVGATAAAPPPPPVLVRAAPNPFNPRTEFSFRLATAADAVLEIHDLRGRRIWASAPGRHGPGPVTIAWNGLGLEGRDAGTGTYVFRLVLDGRATASGRICLVR